MSPLVADVDPALFAGANLDSRTGAISNGLQRVFVAGKHGMNANSSVNLFVGMDGKRHSRALQAGTTHYYQITCGSTLMSGTFTTSAGRLGDTYPEPMPVDATRPGAYNWPDLNPADRTERTIDPVTGSLVRKVTVASDTAPMSIGWPVSGAFQICSHVPIVAGAPYYLCAIPGDYAATLVSVNTATGDVQALSSIVVPYLTIGNGSIINCPNPVFDSSNGAQFYCVAGTSIISGQWNGGMAAPGTFSLSNSDPSLNWTLLTGDLNGLLAAFDPSFTAEQQQNMPYWLPVTVQQGKLIVELWAQQNSSGWVAAFDPAAKAVVAALPVWKAPATRWCGMHNSMPTGDANPWVGVIPNDMMGGTYLGGPYRVIVSGPSGGPISPTDTVLTIQPQNGSYEPAQPDAANSYLMDAQPGDLFFLDKYGNGSFIYGVDEYIELVSKNPLTHTWTVRRGDQMASSPFYLNTGLVLFSDPAVSATAGTAMYAACRAQSMSQLASATLWWNFNQDPHGNALVLPAVSGTTSPEVIEQTHTGGHSVTRGSQNAMADWGCFGGATSCWTAWTQTGGVPGISTANPATHTNARPAFNGVTADPTNGYQMHPSHEQVAAGDAQQGWLLDRMPFINESQGVAQLVAGTASLYQVTGTTLQRDTLPTQATCGMNLLRDISSPATGTQIGDATPYSYCVARKAGECLTNSAAGNIYVSCPGANYRWNGDATSTIRCAGNVLDSASTVDVCVTDATPYGQSVVQAGYSQTLANGDLNRVITQGFSHYHEPNSVYDTAYATPDGAWAMFSSTVTGTPQAYMAKITAPPASSSIRRDSYIPASVSLKPSVSGVDNAIVKFGYVENGAPTDYFCTSRHEACVVGSAGTAAFSWISDSVAGPACATACTVQIPVIPGRVAYYQAIYRNASNVVIATGETGVVTESGASTVSSLTISSLPVSSLPVSITPGSVTLSAGQSTQFKLSDSLGAVTATWSLSATVGSISAAGVYTAPMGIGNTSSVTVKATDANNALRSATAVVNFNRLTPSQTVNMVRVNAGGGAYTDSSKRVWDADNAYSGGSTLSVPAIPGLDTEYLTVRYGSSFSYNFAVPNGSYTVVLKFAEPSYSKPGARAFNVALNGQQVLTNFDIVSAAGAILTPVDKALPVTVSTGSIAIQFTTGSASSPLVNAIEILPFTISAPASTVAAGGTVQFTASAPVSWSVSPSTAAGTISASGLYTAPTTPLVHPVTITATSNTDKTQHLSASLTVQAQFTTLAFAPVRINAGGAAFTDASGNVWQADTDFSGGQTWATTSPVSHDASDAMYQTVRYGYAFTYTIPVPNGAHTVKLDFAEVSQGMAGLRRFNVSINGTPVLTNFDIFAVAGGMLKPIQQTFPVNVTGANIVIAFTTGAANSPMVNGIEVY